MPAESGARTSWLLALPICLACSSAGAQQLRFVRTTDTVAFTPSCVPAPTQITYEAVFRIDLPQSAAQGEIYTEHLAFFYDRQFRISADGLAEYTHPIDGGVAWSVPAAIISGIWHHAAFCYDGAEERFYLDGQRLGARPASGSIAWSCVGGVGAIGFVRRTDGAEQGSFIGSLDSFRLSATARYSGPSFAPPAGDLQSDASTLLLYRFDECFGSDAIDSGPLGRHGVLGSGSSAPTRVPGCGADADCDGGFTPADVAFFVSAWFTAVQNGTPTPAPTDIDANGQINPADIAAFVNVWLAVLTNGC